MVIATRERGDLIVGIRNDGGTHWELGHLDAVWCHLEVRLRGHRRQRVRVRVQRHAQGSCCALPRVVVRCGADPAEAKDDVIGRQGAL